MAEEELATAVAAASPVSSDLKRKLEDLEPEAPEPVVSTTTQVESLVDLNSNEVQNSVQAAQEIADGVLDFPEAKRQRLEEDTDAVEDGHGVQKSDEQLTENPQQATVGILKTENDQQSTMGNLEIVNDQQSTIENLERDNYQHPIAENLQTENDLQSITEKPQIEDEKQTLGQMSIEEQQPMETDQKGISHLSSDDQTGISQHPSEGDLQQSVVISQQGDLSSAQSQVPYDTQTASLKMEIPSNKVGVLIGKAGETIRLLQFNSGAKIQITRDADADPNSTTRPVELIGTLENINKAEKLIKDVIAEADAGGSPSLVAKGFGNPHAGGATEQLHIPVLNEKVGMIIGKGGENIKNLQTKSGARIQLIPQHLSEGDQSKERMIRVTGNKKQIEMAREMIKEVVKQPARSSSRSGNYNQQTNRPRGPSGPQQWGARATPPPVQSKGYDYQQRGMYPSQNSQYPPQTYSGYPQQQSTPRNSFNTGWDQRPTPPVQGHLPQSGGYDYHGQAGGGQITPAPAPVVGPTSTQVNYNYGQPQGQDYGQPATYSQSAPPQQSYGHGYDPRYGSYPQQAGSQTSYSQQPNATPPSYAMPSQGPPPQSYAQPRANQPGNMPYQGGPISSTQSYGQNMPTQQPYPYASSGPTQQTYPYGPTQVTNDGYNQQPPQVASSGPGFPQQSGQAVSGYGQVASGYPQGGPGGGYAQYPSSSQPGYSEQPVPNATVSYGYQGSTDPTYNNAPASTYGGAPPSSGQAGYVQHTPNQAGYDQQTMAQSGGYGGAPVSATGVYVKSLSPQPGYGAQYDTTQMYGGHQ